MAVAVLTTTAHSHRTLRLVELARPTRLDVRWRWAALTCLVLAAFSLLLPQTPTYDPWAWIVWGREIVHGDLITTTGPSWKPLPILFTVPFSLLGSAAPALLVLVGRAAALAGLIVVAQLAARMGGRLSAALAVAAMLTAPLYFNYGSLGSSEGALVLFTTLALLAWSDGKRTAAFWWLLVAAELRPEVWPFLGLVALERLIDRPARIWWLALALALIPLTWLVPEQIGSGHFFRAAERAHDPNANSAAFAAHPWFEVLKSFGNLLLWVPAVALWLAAGLGLSAWWRRRKETGRLVDPDHPRLGDEGELPLVGLAAGLSIAWIVIVAAMTEGGYAGNPRYLMAPMAFLVALGCCGVVWAMRELASRRLALAGELLVLVAIVALVLTATHRMLPTAQAVAYQARDRQQLVELSHNPVVRASIATCGPITTHPLLIPNVAWTFHQHLEDVRYLDVTRGTLLVGANVPSARPSPSVPPGLGFKLIAQTSQWRVYANCHG